MKRDEKAKLIEQLKDRFDRAKVVILADYKGISVEEVNRLRRLLEKQGGIDLLVAKNTLVRRAVDGTVHAELTEHLVGPNSLLFGYDDPVAPTKAMVDFAKSAKALDIKVGMVGARLVKESELNALASLPNRETLQALLLATMQAPASGIVRLLAQVPRGLLNLLTAYKEKLEQAA